MFRCTIQSSLAKAARTLFELGMLHAGFWPNTVMPLILPAYITSNRVMTE